MRKPKIEVGKPRRRKILVQEGPVFNEYNKESIYAYLRLGNHFTTSAKLAGISVRTAKDWHSQGLADTTDFENGTLDVQTEKGDFYIRCEQAQAEFTAERVAKVVVAGNDPMFWQANRFLLGSLNNEEYGRKQTVTVDKTETKKITFEIVPGGVWKKDQIEEKSTIKITDGNTMEAEYTEEVENEE